MERQKARLEGSLWNKGVIGLLFGGIMLAGLLIWVPAIRWFLAISVVIGLIMAGIIHFWNEHRPIKSDEQDQVRLHLLDDDK